MHTAAFVVTSQQERRSSESGICILVKPDSRQVVRWNTPPTRRTAVVRFGPKEREIFKGGAPPSRLVWGRERKNHPALHMLICIHIYVGEPPLVHGRHMDLSQYHSSLERDWAACSQPRERERGREGETTPCRKVHYHYCILPPLLLLLLQQYRYTRITKQGRLGACLYCASCVPGNTSEHANPHRWFGRDCSRG